MKHLNPDCPIVDLSVGNCPKCNPPRRNDHITEKWKEETINQANALAEREAIYRRGFGEGFTKSREETLSKVLEVVDSYNLGGSLDGIVEIIKAI